MSRITNSLLLLASSFIGIGVSAPVMALTTIPLSSDTTINSAVVLVDDTIYQSTNGSSLTFDSTVDGAYSLTVDTTGAVTFNDAVGGTTNLSSLSVSGTSLLNGNVTTTGGQTYTGAVMLGGDATLASTANGTIDFASTLDGTHNLKTTTGGATTFVGAIGSTAALSKLDVTGGTFSANALKVNGSLSAKTTTGDITQGTGIFEVSGTSALNAGSNAITLTNANLFGGAVSLTGGNVSLVNAGATILGTSTVTGTLNVSTTGALSQTGALTVTGLATFTQNGAGQDIDLGSQLNDFQGGETFAGTINNLSLKNIDATLGTLTLPASVSGNLTLNYTHAGLILPLGGVSGNLDVSASGSITINGDVTTGGSQRYRNAVLLGNDVTLDTTHSAVTFDSTVDNATAAARMLTINAGTGALTFSSAVGGINGALQGLTTSSGLFSARALTLGSGGLSVTTTTGDITQGGAFVLAGAASFNAGSHAVTLTNANNDFQGTVSATGAGIALADVNDLDLVSLTDNANGNVSLTAGGMLTLPLSGINAGMGNLTLAANGGALLTGGALTGTDISLTGRDGVTLGGDVDAGGLLTLTSTNAAIMQSAGTITASGITTVNAGTGAITLTQANTFVGAVNLTGGTAQITNIIALTLGTVNTGALTATSTGALNLGSGTVVGALAATSNNGAISQSGALTVNGISTINAGTGAITLTNFNNDFIGAVALTGGTTQIADKNSLTLGTLQTGALTADSTGALNLGSGTVGGNLAATSNNGAISEGGALTVNGTSLINAGTGAITLASPGTSFGGQVSASGSAVSIANSVPLALGTVASTGALALTATGVTNNVSLVFGNGVTAGNVTGNYSQISAAALSLHANASTADQLAISGTATLGGTLNVAFASAPSVGQSFTVVSSTGARSNTFATVNVTGLAAGTQAQTVYNSNNVQLKIEGTPATHFSLSAPTPVTAGASASGLTVTALDASNNSTTGYTGTVHFISTDGSAVLPADTTLTNGTGTFNFTLNSAGSQIISATDTATSSITGASNAIVVNVGTQTISFTSTPPTHPLVGASYTVTATASSGLTVAFSIDAASTAGACTISAATVTFTGIGTCIIDADQAGDASFTAAPQAQQSIAVAAAPVPTPMLDRWALLLLTGLLGLFGFTRTRRA